MGTPVPASDLPDNKAVPAADMPDGMTNVRANREPTGLKEPDEWMPYLFNAIKKVPGDIASMLDVPEMEPYATMGKIAHKLTGTVPPKHKSAKETIDTAMGAKDLPTPRDATGKPDFRPEILANVLEYGGAGVLTGGGIGAAEKAGAGMLKSALTGAVKGGTAGASSGAWTYEGKQIGEMIGGEKGGNIGETVAAFVMPQVTGGASGFAMKQARKGYAKAAEKVPFLMSEEAKKTAAAESASKEMTDALRAHTDTEKNMARSKEVEAQIPGMETTIGRRTGAPGAIAAENYVNERSPEAMAKAQAAEAKTRSAIESKKAELYPEGDKTTTGILQANNEANVNRMQRNLNRYDRMLERQAENLQRTDTAEAGANIRQLYDERMKAAKNTVGAKYGLAYATAETNKVRPSIEGVYKTAEEVDKAAANKFQKEPGVIGDIIRAYKGESVKPVEKKLGPGRMTLRGEKPEIKKDVSFEEFHSLYKRANEEYYKALLSTDPAAPNMARLIGKVRDQLHGEITKYEGTEYGDLAKHFKEANRAYAEDYLQTFKKGVGGEI